MKLWQKLALAILAAGVAAVLTIFLLRGLVREKTAADTLPSSRTIQELQACTSDSDCTLVNKTCCSCGETLAINKMFTDDYRKSLRCYEVSCTMQFCEIPQTSRCKSNICVSN